MSKNRKQDQEPAFRRGGTRLPFTMFPNYLLEDKRIKGAPLHILLYLLSKPDNWVPRPKDIRSRTGFARTAYDNAIKKLESAGYLHTELVRSKKTGSLQTIITFYENPAENPLYDGELPDYYCYGNKTKKDSPSEEKDEQDKHYNNSTTKDNIHEKNEKTNKKYKNYEDNCDNFEFGNTEGFYFED